MREDYENHFDEFLDVCKKQLKSDFQILSLVKQVYKKTSPKFLRTNEFRDIVQCCRTKIESNPSKIFVYIKDLVDELKSFKDKKRKRDGDDECHSVGKKPRTLLLSASVELNAHEKFSKRHQNRSTDEESITNSDGGTVVTVVADVHPNKRPTIDSEQTPALLDAAPPFIRPKNVNGSSSSNCSVHINDCIDGFDSAPEQTSSQPRNRLRLRRVQLQKAVDSDDGSGSVVPSNADFNTSDAVSMDAEDESWAPPKTSHKTSSATEISLKNNTSETVLENGVSASGTNESEMESNAKPEKVKKCGSQRQIQRLEKVMFHMDVEIKRLQAKEISLDDLDDNHSYYMRSEHLKSKVQRVFFKLCELKEREKSTGRIKEKKFLFEGTRYPEVNKAIRRFVNKHQIFPDYRDISDIIRRVNVKHKLQLKKAAIDALCREAFTDVGNQLQRRRCQDFVMDFGCHLTDSDRNRPDPALFDRELQRKLEQNRKTAQSKMDEVLEKYSRKQYDDPNGTTEDDASIDDDEDVEDEEDRIEEETQEMELQEVLDATDTEDEETDSKTPGGEVRKRELITISDEESEAESDESERNTSNSPSDSDDDVVVEGVTEMRDDNNTDLSPDAAEKLESFIDMEDVQVVGIVRNSEKRIIGCRSKESQDIADVQVIGVVGNAKEIWSSQEMASVSDSQTSVELESSRSPKEAAKIDIDTDQLGGDAKCGLGSTKSGCLESRDIQPAGDCKLNMGPDSGKTQTSKKSEVSEADTSPKKFSLKIGKLGQRNIENIVMSLKFGRSVVPGTIEGSKCEDGASDVEECVGGRVSPGGVSVHTGVNGGEGKTESVGMGDARAQGDDWKEALTNEVCTISDNESDDPGRDDDRRDGNLSCVVWLDADTSEEEADAKVESVNKDNANVYPSYIADKMKKQSKMQSSEEDIPSIDAFDIISTPVKKYKIDSEKLKLKCSPGFVSRTRDVLIRNCEDDDNKHGVKFLPVSRPKPEVIEIDSD